MSKFTVDFFEFAFLVEACIPPRPIARSMFWDDVCNKHYHNMTPGERSHLYEWIIKHPSFDIENDQCNLFAARFNPDNQYNITTKRGDEIKKHDAFLYYGKYHTQKHVSILENYITVTEKITYENKRTDREIAGVKS
jgi:hypothetical protein